jgi:3',5'-cyclic AMP phosphodiesterase CpdA
MKRPLSQKTFSGFLTVVAIASGQAEPPLLSFGVISDVQYADQPDLGARAYRDSPAKLQWCASAMRKERPSFVIHLGDFVDAGAASLDRISPVWNKMPAPRYHVLGNHDFVVPGESPAKRMGMPAPWYDFSVKSWRFVILDGMNLSAGGRWPKSDPRNTEAEKLLDGLKTARARNAQIWNGAVGPVQREWLKQTLANAARDGQRAIVFCHFPVLAESCRPEHLLWDHAEVLSVIESSGTVAAYINGHDHRGGSASRNGIPYLTVPGMVEHDS